VYRGALPADERRRRDVVTSIVSSVEHALSATGARARDHAVGRELAGHLAAGGPPGPPVDIHIRLDDAHLEVQIAPAARDEPQVPEFRTWLLQRLRAQGLSQESAARRIGVSTRTVGRWARGQTQPRMRDLPRVREALGELPAF
jgi:Helix-turn-helix